MLRAEQYRIDKREIAGQRVNITSYMIGDRYHCHVDNVDPGAVISRAEGPTQDVAIQAALAKAQERLIGKERG